MRRKLSLAILQVYFALQLRIPANQLIPTIPSRLDYILWIEDLMGSKSEAVGVDVGTGPSCIYPLLGCSRHEDWNFFATGIVYKLISLEIQATSFEYASSNIKANGLEDRITLILKSDGDKILPDLVGVDFTMCNPPFYSSEAEIRQLKDRKRFEPYSKCTGNKTEMITEGGELSFITQMIQESIESEHRTTVSWFTSLVAKKTDYEEILAHLRSKPDITVRHASFQQGRTRRYFIAWGFK